MTHLDQIHAFIKRWRICTADLIRTYAKAEGLQKRTLEKHLQVLRARGFIESLRLGRVWYHLDCSFDKRTRYLKKLAPVDRYKAFCRMGMLHDLFLVQIGMKLEESLSGLSVYPNLFRSYVSFTKGTISVEGKKYIPDMIIFDPDKEKRLIYIEFERYVKSYSRCTKLWSAYEQDKSILGAVYITPDEAKRNLINARIEDYLNYDLRINPEFYLASLTEKDFQKFRGDCAVQVFKGRSRSESRLSDLLGALKEGTKGEVEHA